MKRKLAALICLSVVSACTAMPSSPTPIPAETASTVGSRGNGPGNSPAQLSRAGWTCLDVPGHGVHCFPSVRPIGNSVAIPVLVYDTSDPGDSAAPFLGTEIMIRADKYQGQPCLPGHGDYSLLPFGYYACHHYE